MSAEPSDEAYKAGGAALLRIAEYLAERDAVATPALNERPNAQPIFTERAAS